MSGRSDSYLGIRPSSTYGSSFRHPGEQMIPYSDAALFVGSSQDQKRGDRLQDALLRALALYGFSEMSPSYAQSNEEEEKERRRRELYASLGWEVPSARSYQAPRIASRSMPQPEGGLEKNLKKDEALLKRGEFPNTFSPLNALSASPDSWN